MVKKTKSKIPELVDYDGNLKKFHNKKTLKRIVYAVLSQFKKENEVDENIITIKIGTSKDSLPIEDIITLLKSAEIIIKNICVALGYKSEDIGIQLIQAKPGCFLIDLAITIAQGAVAKYCAGFTEEFCNIDFEKEGRRQAKMIKEIFQKFMTSPKFKNATTLEAKNIQSAKSEWFKTLHNNKNIQSVNFTKDQDKKIIRAKFLDYIA